jgi:membrane-associated protease RseP (regulator of RpoE activity)
MDVALARPAQRPLLHLALLLLTFAATLATYLVMWNQADWNASGHWDWSRIRWRDVRNSLQFSLALVAILGSHEMGHWVAARWHRVETSLPYFIPLPLLGFGTLGAVIRIRSPIPTRNALVDIGAAGPVAGFLVALPILVWGYAHAELVRAVVVPDGLPAPDSALGLFLALFGPGLKDGPAVTLFGDNLLTLLVQRLTVGVLPPGADVGANPFIMAGWFGCLVTMLNLIPIGQLDGGHLTFANLGGGAVSLGKAAAGGLLALTLFFNWSWLVWLVVVSLVVRFRHPDVLRPEEPLDGRRVAVCIACLAIFALCIIPSPLRMVLLPVR